MSLRYVAGIVLAGRNVSEGVALIITDVTTVVSANCNKIAGVVPDIAGIFLASKSPVARCLPYVVCIVEAGNEVVTGTVRNHAGGVLASNSASTGRISD